MVEAAFRPRSARHNDAVHTTRRFITACILRSVITASRYCSLYLRTDPWPPCSLRPAPPCRNGRRRVPLASDPVSMLSPRGRQGPRRPYYPISAKTQASLLLSTTTGQLDCPTVSSVSLFSLHRRQSPAISKRYFQLSALNASSTFAYRHAQAGYLIYFF